MDIFVQIYIYIYIYIFFFFSIFVYFMQFLTFILRSRPSWKPVCYNVDDRLASIIKVDLDVDLEHLGKFGRGRNCKQKNKNKNQKNILSLRSFQMTCSLIYTSQVTCKSLLLHICSSICLSICLSINVSVNLFISLSIYLYIISSVMHAF